MDFLEKKFNKEIEQLKALQNQGDLLYPLSQSQIKQNLLRQIHDGTVTNSVPKRYIQTQDNLTLKKFMLYKYALVVLLGLGLTGGTVFASENSKPGDLLFPVKKAKEQIQLSLAVSSEAKTNLQSRFAEKRVDELVEVKNDLKADVKAQTQAETEANQAIQTLTEVKTQLEAKGNTTAASAINETILRLRTRLENPTEEKRMDKEDENKDFHNNSDEDENISNQRTTQDKPLVKVELKGQVVNQNGQLQISAGGKTYILANTITGTSLQSFVGKFVELKGVASGSMVTVTQIEAKDANEKSEAKEENERDDDDDDDDRGQNSGSQATSTPPAPAPLPSSPQV
jgi:hypothetical protein